MVDTYHPPILTIDAVVFQLIDGVLNILLLQRAAEPFKGAWALPGGYSSAGETTRQATARVLLSKTGLDAKSLSLLDQLIAVDSVARDPRGHAVSIVYLGLGKNLILKESKTTQNPKFFAVNDLPELAYDHDEIIETAVLRLRAMIRETNTIKNLLPEEFTLTELQTAYESILGRQLDKRNFRKRFLLFDGMEPTNSYSRVGAHRPAMKYRFNSFAQESLQRNFD